MNPPADVLEVAGVLADPCERLKLDLSYVRDWAEKMLPAEHRDEIERWVLQYAK